MVRKEQRKIPRKRFHVKVKYGTKILEHTGYTTDISPDGIGIKTNRVYRPGTEVLICIELDGDTLLARGEVRWARQVPQLLVNHTRCGMEIKLTSFNKRYLDFLKKWYDKADLEQAKTP